MNGKRLFFPAAVLAAVFSFSCQAPVSGVGGSRTVPDLDRAVYIVNTFARTVSVFDPVNLTMYNNVMAVGQTANDIKYWDGRLFIVNSTDNSVQVFDESDYSLLKTIYLGTGRNPYSIIIDTDRERGVIPNLYTGTVSVIDLNSYEIIDEISVGRSPEYGCYLGGKVYVANTEYYDNAFNVGSVSVIDSAADVADIAVVATVTIGSGANPQTILPVPSLNQVHVVCSGNNDGTEDDDGTIVIIDASNSNYNIVETLAIGGSPLVSADGYDSVSGRVYLAGTGGIMTYLSATPSPAEHGYLNFFYGADALISATVYDTDGVYDYVYALDFGSSRLLLIDPTTGALVRSISTSDGPIAMTIVSK